MKIAHLLSPDGKWDIVFRRFMLEHFQDDPHEHHFIYFMPADGPKIQPLSREERIIEIRRGKGAFSFCKAGRFAAFLFDTLKSTVLDEYEKIFLHFLTLEKMLHAIKMNDPERLHWVLWGGDFYNTPRHKNGLELFAHSSIKKHAVRKIGNLCSLLEEDYEKVCNTFDVKPKYHKIFYPNLLDLKTLEETKKPTTSEEPGKSLRILVGNSATITNEHDEILTALKKLSFEKPPTILCPLSYGDEKYALEVAHLGEDLFDKNFVPITEFMKPDDYSHFLNSVDIGIFAHKRQQAVGNIVALLLLGKKVFIRSDVTTYSWLKRLGVTVYDTMTILKDQNPDFSPMDSEARQNNRTIIKSEFSEERCISLWQEVFKA